MMIILVKYYIREKNAVTVLEELGGSSGSGHAPAFLADGSFPADEHAGGLNLDAKGTAVRGMEEEEEEEEDEAGK